MKTFASLTSAAVTAILAAFVGALAGFFVGFIGVLAFGVAFASLPMFGVGGAALFGLVGAYKGFTGGAGGSAAAAGAASLDGDWASDDAVVDASVDGFKAAELMPNDFNVMGDDVLIGGKDD